MSIRLSFLANLIGLFFADNFLGFLGVVLERGFTHCICSRKNCIPMQMNAGCANDARNTNTGRNNGAQISRHDNLDLLLSFKRSFLCFLLVLEKLRDLRSILDGEDSCTNHAGNACSYQNLG